MADCLVSRWLNKTKSMLLRGLESFVWALWQWSIALRKLLWFSILKKENKLKCEIKVLDI